MKLILLSKHFTENICKELLSTTSLKPEKVRIAFIANAGDLEASKEYIELSKKELQSFGLNPENLDLENYINNSENLEKELAKYHAAFFTGGNVFYLRHMFEKTGLFKIYKRILEKSLIHIGFSAGSMICSPHLRYYKHMDISEEGFKVLDDGLNLFPHFIVPHYSNKIKYTKAFEKIVKHLEKPEDLVIPLENHQGIVINNSNWEII